MENGENKKKGLKTERCIYLKACYMAEDLQCFGLKTDCPLYQKSNGGKFSEENFDRAMDRLINKTRAKHLELIDSD